MNFWYLIDTPRDKPCWEINPNLWDYFVLESSRTSKHTPAKDSLYTEAYVVQMLDTVIYTTKSTTLENT